MYKDKLKPIAVLLLVLILFVGCQSPAVADISHEVSHEVSRIELNRIEEHMSILTSTKANGRLAGTEGNLYIENYLADEFLALGLVTPDFVTDYRHAFDMRIPMKQQASVLKLLNQETNETHTFRFGYDYMEFVSMNHFRSTGKVEGEFTLIDDPFALSDAPENHILVFNQSGIGHNSYKIFFDTIFSSGKRPKAVLFVNDNQNNGFYIGSPASLFLTGNDNINGPIVMSITSSTYEALKQVPQGTLTIDIDVELTEVTVNNIVGFLPGTVDEGYIICAHFDHLGDNLDGTVNTGALDNASGTAAMLEIARVLAETPNRELSYYFIAYNGEEAGLWGSEAFAKMGYVDPSAYKVVNLDMIGASDNIPLLIAATAEHSDAYASAFLEHIQRYGFEAERSYSGGSDHFPMEQEGFVAFGIIDFDTRYYHTPYDTTELAVDLERTKAIAEAVLDWVRTDQH